MPRVDMALLPARHDDPVSWATEAGSRQGMEGSEQHFSQSPPESVLGFWGGPKFPSCPSEIVQRGVQTPANIFRAAHWLSMRFASVT